MKNKYIEYINKFQEGNEYGIYFIENNYKEGELTQDEVEQILDFVYSNKKKYKNISNKTILEKSKAWHKKISEQASSKDNEVEGVDYSIEYDFGDGFKFVKLISKEAYEREGKLSSNCVASYYGRNVEIFSLRDNKNLPHCTIEANNQVKGKGNQTVDNKYFDYCIKFLEYKGYSIGENEMKNIGYYKLDSIDKDLSVDEKYLYDGQYISDKNLDKIKDKDGKQYYGFGLLKVKKLFTFDINMKVKFNFNIEDIKKYFINSLKKLDLGNYSQLAGGDDSQLALGNYSQLAGGDDSQLAGGDYSKLAGGDESQLSGGNYSQLAGGDDSQLAGGNNSKLAGGYKSQLAGGYYSQLAGGNRSQLAGGDESQLAGGSYSKLAGGNYSQLAGGARSRLVGGDYSQLAGLNRSQLAGGNRSQLAGGNRSQLAGGYASQLAGGDESKLILNGNNGLAIGGNGSIFKGKIGSWFAIGEIDNNGNYVNFKVGKIDGVNLKEDIFYKLQNGEFVEVVDDFIY